MPVAISPFLPANNLNSIAKYNPQLQGAEELEAMFVARRQELEVLSEMIRGTKPGIAPKHTLLIGRTGMGKTTLLHRVALLIEQDRELHHHWLPLRFAQELYTISTPAELWRHMLSVLADTLEVKNQPTAAIDKLLADTQGLPPQDSQQKLLNFIDDWCRQHKKRLLLIVDRTDQLLQRFANAKRARQSTKNDTSDQLAEVLCRNPNLLWLGSSQQDIDQLPPTAGLFHSLELRPLTVQETTDAVCAMARTFGLGCGLSRPESERAVRQWLGERPEWIKALCHILDGSPRQAVMLYELLTIGGTGRVPDDLLRVLDLATPHYQSRLDNLPEQQRKLMAHMMDLWRPLSLGELSDASGVVNTQISPQLQRMEKDGHIVKVALPGTTRAGYQLKDRTLNIWYLMRNAPRTARRRLFWFAGFVGHWYSPFSTSTFTRPPRKDAPIPLSFTLESQQAHVDGKIASAEQYQKRFESLQQRLMQLPFAKTPKRRVTFCSKLLASLRFSFEQKERLVDLLNDKKRYAELDALLTSEYLNCKKADIRAFMGLVVTGQVQLDQPEQLGALKQLQRLATEVPSFFWPLARRFWDKFQDERIDHLIAVVCSGGDPLNLYNSHDFAYLLQQRYCNLQVRIAATAWFADYLERCNAVMAYTTGDILLCDLKDHNMAETAFRRAVELDVNYAAAWLRLADIYLEHLGGDPERAKQAYLRALECDKNNLHVNYNLGRICAIQGRHEQAREWFKITSSLCADSGLKHLSLQANLYLNNLGLADEALSAMAQSACNGDRRQFQLLAEQCIHSHLCTKGLVMADLMANNLYSGYLEPFEQALRILNGDDQSVKGVCVETARLATEIGHYIERKTAHFEQTLWP